MEGLGPTGIWSGNRHAIELAFKPAEKRGTNILVGMRSAGEVGERPG